MARRQPLHEKSLEEEFDLSVGDDVVVDWSEGMGHWDEVEGTIEGVHKGPDGLIVDVKNYGDMDFPQGRGFDASPEWIEKVDRERPVRPGYLEDAMEPTDDPTCPTCGASGYDVKPMSSAGAVVQYRCTECGSTFNQIQR